MKGPIRIDAKLRGGLEKHKSQRANKREKIIRKEKEGATCGGRWNSIHLLGGGGGWGGGGGGGVGGVGGGVGWGGVSSRKGSLKLIN